MVSGPSASRAVRIPRAAAREGPGVRPTAAPGPIAPGDSAPVNRRPNRAGTRRAVRLSSLFVLGVAALFTAFALYARTVPGGDSPGALQALEIFAAFAVAIAVGGAVLALASAPRAVEFRPRGTVVIGRFGRRRVFPGVSELTVRLVRRYPSGFLSEGAVDAVEVVGGRARGTYLLEEGILEITYHDRPRAEG